MSHRSVCFSCKRAKEGGRNPAAPKTPNPETALRQQIKTTTEEPVKEALDAALKKAQEAKLQSLSARDQKNRLMSQAKNLAEKIDKQTEVKTEAELARGRYQDELAEVHLKLRKTACGRGPSAPDSPGGWRDHRPNESSFAIRENTSPHRGPYSACGAGGPRASGWGWERRCGHGRGFGRPGVWRAGPDSNWQVEPHPCSTQPHPAGPARGPSTGQQNLAR